MQQWQTIVFLLLEKLKDVLSKSGEIHESVSTPVVGGVEEQMLKTNIQVKRSLARQRKRKKKMHWTQILVINQI